MEFEPHTERGHSQQRGGIASKICLIS